MPFFSNADDTDDDNDGQPDDEDYVSAHHMFSRILIFFSRTILSFRFKIISYIGIETYNNIARYNIIDTKYCQMAFRSPSDGAPISPNQPSFGTPGQTKVSGDRQRETTHEICCLAAE
jgi:hypothetical protein